MTEKEKSEVIHEYLVDLKDRLEYLISSEYYVSANDIIGDLDTEINELKERIK